MKRLSCVFLIALALLVERSTARSMPSNALIVRSPRQASAASVFGDLTTNDTSVSIILEPSAPWEDFIIPGPTIIALLGQLMVISGTVDFSLVENAPLGGFKYMTHPESFRASLVQVSNDGWGAFMNAHKNMDKIQLYMQQIPAQVKTAIKILSQASPKLVERLLPITLNTIQNIGRTCVQLSAETESKFADVMLLLGELLAVTESSRGTHQQKLAEVQAELNVTAVQKQYMEQIGDELKKQQQKIDSEVTKYRNDYDQALKDIPTGWKAIFQDLGRSIVGLVNYVPQMLGMGGFGGKHAGGNTGSIGGGPSPDFEKSKTLGVVQNFFSTIGKVKDTITGIFKGKRKADEGNPADMSSAFSTVLNTFEKMLSGGSPSEYTSQALGFINEGKSICNDIQGMFSQFPARPVNQSDQEHVENSLDNLLNGMKPLLAKASTLTAGLSTGESGPHADYSGTGGNERFKADLARARLRDAEARYDQVFGEVMKYHEEMKDLVSKMASLNLKEINFEQILELLKQGIKLLAKIRQQWGKLVQFFTLVSVRAEVALNQTLVPFVEYAKQAEEQIGQGDLSKEDRQFYLGLLQDQAVDINKVAYFLYTLSSTYFDVSTRFLMDRLAGLAQMLATDNADQRQKLLITLRNQANEAQDAIKQMSQQRREEYSQLVNARKRELDDIVNKLGGPTDADTKAIQSVYGN